MEPIGKSNTINGMVSIIIPVYNAEKYLQRCVESAMAQTYSNIEILLVDDGSIDGSGKLCDEYVRKDRRIKVIHKKNGGPSDARNTGIEHSQGEFIFFMDADDSIEANAIGVLMERYTQTDADVVIGDYRKIGNTILSSGHELFFKESTLMEKDAIVSYARSYLKKPNKFQLIGYSWGRLFRASIIRDNNIHFDSSLHTYEDVSFNFKYLRHVTLIYFLNQIIYNYTLSDTYASATMSMSGNPDKLLGYRQALIDGANFLKGNLSDSDIEKEIGHAYIFLSIIQLVRMCGQYNRNTKKSISNAVTKLINTPTFRSYLKYYTPAQGDSKILPILMRLGFAWPVISVCRYKAYKRYRNMHTAK